MPDTLRPEKLRELQEADLFSLSKAELWAHHAALLAHIDALTAAVEALPPWLRTDEEAGIAAGETGAIDVVERSAVLAILRGEQ
jgi:hypothetical protein